jgi:hypothetical protein
MGAGLLGPVQFLSDLPMYAQLFLPRTHRPTSHMFFTLHCSHEDASEVLPPIRRVRRLQALHQGVGGVHEDENDEAAGSAGMLVGRDMVPQYPSGVCVVSYGHLLQSIHSC